MLSKQIMQDFKLIISASEIPDGSSGLRSDSELVDADELDPRDVQEAVEGAISIHIKAPSAKYIVEEEHGLRWNDALEEFGDRDFYDVGDLFRWLGY